MLDAILFNVIARQNYMTKGSFLRTADYMTEALVMPDNSLLHKG